MIYRLILGGQCIGTYKALRSAKSAYDLVDFALRVAKVVLRPSCFVQK